MDGNEERGFQRIGSLKLPNGNSPDRSGSTRNGLPTNSATTGGGLPARKDASSTGRRLSAIAAASLRPVIAAMAADRPEPYRVDNLLVASLPLSVGSALRQETRSWNDPVYGYHFEITGYSLRRAPPDADMATALEMVEWCCRAVAEPHVIKMLLAELRVSTKSRTEAEDDAALGYQVYANELVRYPADIACAAVRKLARSERFYPSLSELREHLLRESRRRRLLRKALRSPVQPEDPPRARTVRTKPTAEDIAYIDELLAPLRAETKERAKTLRNSGKYQNQKSGPQPSIMEGDKWTER